MKNIAMVVTRYGYLFLDGIKYTLILSLISVLFGTILGAGIAFMRRSRFVVVRGIATTYVEIIRGTPLLLQLYFFYLLLPMILPFDISAFLSVSLALVFNSAAYVSEIIRAGIQAVDKGQTEAARSLGLSGGQTMLRIVLPQAVKNILPALCNEFVMVIKETSLASTFFIGDIMTKYKEISGALYLVIEPLLVAGVIYFVLTFTLSKLIAVLERRMKAHD
ncbi:amino acid ABC transporter permease [Oscillospiraceae bacterium OttesenSCG-928-F05]|nr:amino acid ABC transporter permease [Oscillospiraceae bacterium OttesenSCG-928-F05]